MSHKKIFNEFYSSQYLNDQQKRFVFGVFLEACTKNGLFFVNNEKLLFEFLEMCGWYNLNDEDFVKNVKAYYMNLINSEIEEGFTIN